MTNDKNKHLQPANSADFKQYSNDAVARALAARLSTVIARDRADRLARLKVQQQPVLTVIKGGK